MSVVREYLDVVEASSCKLGFDRGFEEYKPGSFLCLAGDREVIARQKGNSHIEFFSAASGEFHGFDDLNEPKEIEHIARALVEYLA